MNAAGILLCEQQYIEQKEGYKSVHRLFSRRLVKGKAKGVEK